MDEPKPEQRLFDAAVGYDKETIQISIRGLARLTCSAGAEYRFLTFKGKPQPPRSLAAVDARLRDILRALVSGEERWPLYLHGPVGIGKTIAGVCVCDHVRGSWYGVEDQLAKAVLNDNTDFWNTVWNASVTVLDELGTWPSSDDTWGKILYKSLQRFADYRERHNRVAIYLSNLTPEELADIYDDRIVDRLACGTVFHLKGESRRR